MTDASGTGAAAAAAAVFPGDSEMAARCRALDWGATPLGPVARWPESLRAAARSALAHPFPHVVLWGPALVQLYNDGYRAMMGVKHPAGLGQPTRECWPEVWAINAPIYERVRAGESLAFEDALYPITRSGQLEDAWFTLSYSPLRGDAGAVAGVLVTVFETTARVRAERRLGLAGMRERAALVGGTVLVESAPGAGTTVYVRLPRGDSAFSDHPAGAGREDVP